MNIEKRIKKYDTVSDNRLQSVIFFVFSVEKGGFGTDFYIHEVFNDYCDPIFSFCVKHFFIKFYGYINDMYSYAAMQFYEL